MLVQKTKFDENLARELREFRTLTPKQQRNVGLSFAASVSIETCRHGNLTCTLGCSR